LRQEGAFVEQEKGLSERRACRLLELDRSSYRYQAVADGDAELRGKLLELARQKPRYGYRRLNVLLQRQGQTVNVKRVYRLYREEGLMVRRQRRKRLVRSMPGEPRLQRANQE
jgi:putative transposase